MTTESTTADPGPAPARRRPRRGFRGGWYFVISIASAGFLAWVPFVHAATRLGRPRPVIRNAVLFGAGAVVLGVLAALSPTTAEGHPATTTSAVMEPIYVISMLCVIAGACLLQAPLRRRVFFGEKPAEPAVDPAVAAVLAARARRDEARELARRDPLLARELHIGRPDLHGAYDDGGLVDLGSAPAEAIAAVCEVDRSVADAIVSLRESAMGLLAVDDVFSLTEVPLPAWERIRDRAPLIG